VNVDLAFIVQALDRTFNPRLLERFLYMAMDARVKPVVALNKADIAEDLERQLAEARAVAGATPILVVSARTGQAVADLRQFLAPGRTVVFLGASGVGKSSLINQLYGENILTTTAVRETDDKGRHTTSWRELIVLDQEGVVIDTPGLREFQLWLTGAGLAESFADIETLAVRCHFRACSHTVEKGCAVLAAIQNGALASDRLHNFQKLKSELEGFSRATQWQQPRRPRSTGGRAPRHSDFERKNRRHFPRSGP
jgi:ribosome biogenesis GTPase